MFWILLKQMIFKIVLTRGRNMKFLIFSILSLFFTSSLLAASDFQTISDEGLTEVSNIVENIKSNLRNAINHEQKRSSAKHKIQTNPSEYDLGIIQEEWDAVIADLQAGRFCNGCHKSKKQFEAEGKSFEDHIREVNQGTSPASQKDFDNVNNKYSTKYNIAKDVNETYNKAREERSRLIWNATNLTNQLHSKIQITYDFQMKVYFPIRENAKEVTFKDLVNLLVSQDLIIGAISDNSSNEYKNYVYERYSTTEQIDSALISLNQKRVALLNMAEAKKATLLRKINDIQILANQTGEDEVPSGSITAVSFGYVPLRDVYFSVRNQEKLESMLSSDGLNLYKKVKMEGR